MAADDPSLAVDLAPCHPAGLRLRNPVMIASGTFGWDGYGRALVGQDLRGQIIHPVSTGPQIPLPESPDKTGSIDFERLGAVVAKTVTMKPREGNPEPRWHPKSWRNAQLAGEDIYLNSIGLTNPGIRNILTEHAPYWVHWNTPVVLSLAGETVEEFGVMAAMADSTPGIAGIELNLSCPNVDNGAAFSHSAQMASETVRLVKDSTSFPVLAKLSPNVPDIVSIAKAVEDAGADAITLTNTVPAMAIDLDSRRPILGGITGGISGPALRPIALVLVYKTSQAVNIPVVGVGGVFKYTDALEFIFAGATAVQVGSANLADFWAPLSVLDGLQAYMDEHGIEHISEIIGAAWNIDSN